MKNAIFCIICIAVIVAACASSEKAMKEEPMMEEAMKEAPMMEDAMKEAPMMEDAMKMEEMPFGGADDVAYANTLWEKMEMGGFNSMPAPAQPGESPHGAVIEILEGKIDGKSVIVKRNYGGEGVSVEAVEMDRAKFLAAVTVMAKREDGYDVENSDWFWVKYLPDGGIDSNPAGMALAGRVAKGMDTGCISCHLAAIATDMVFAHDENNGLKVKMLE